MSTLSDGLKNITRDPKWKIHLGCILCIVTIYEFLKFYYPIFKDVFFFGAASIHAIYIVFFVNSVKLKLETTKQKLIGAMFGGFLIWMFIESASKLFAKWAVWKFF